GAQLLTIKGRLSTVGGASTRNLRIQSQYVNSSTYLYAQMAVSTNGSVTIALYRRVNATNTTMVNSTTVTTLSANTADQAFTWTLKLEGTTASSSINGQTISATVPQADVTALRAGTSVGITSAGFVAGDSIDELTVELTESTPAPELVLYNASF